MASSHSDSLQIIRRYAGAVFALAQEEKALEAVGKDLAALTDMAGEIGALSQTLHNPTVPRAEKAALMNMLQKKIKAHALTAKFLERLALNNRLALLPGIAAEYRRMLSEHQGEVTIEIITAQPLDAKNEKSLMQAFEKEAGKKARFVLTVDPAILGGVMVKMGSKLLDNSVRGKLERLRGALHRRIAAG